MDIYGSGNMFNCLLKKENMTWVLLGVVGAFLVASMVDEEERELYGNILLMVGQILVILAL